MIEKKEIYCNVKKIITQLDREYKKFYRKREERRKKALKNPSGYFLKDNTENKEYIDEILDDFIDYWYGLTQCDGIIREKVVKEYISNFLKKNKSNNLRRILKKFEQKIIEDGGVVKIS